MRKASIKMHNREAGVLMEEQPDRYVFQYHDAYNGPAISLTMPLRKEPYVFDEFPPFFESLLPEGGQLMGLLSIRKIDQNDYFQQLMATGRDLVGAVTVVPLDNA